MISGLSQEDFLQILVAAEKIDGVLVGGQALNIWADFLLCDDEFDEMGPFTSKDIDFWGNRQAAKDLAEALCGRVFTPSDPFDNSPSSAAVTAEFNGESHQIDFLKTVCGIKTDEMLNQAQILVVDEIPVTVLHPLDVLKSRIAGIIILRRNDAGALRQLRAAPVIVARYIEQLLEIGEIKMAQGVVREFLHLGLNRDCDPLFRDHGFDPAPLLHALSRRPEWHPEFAKHQISDATIRAEAARKRRNAEVLRKRARAGS